MPADDALLARARARLERLLAHDADLRRALPSREALDEIASCPTTIDCVAKAFALYADRPCFGERTPGGPYRLLRYSEVWARVEAFASGLVHEGLAGPGTFVGICGFGDVDWVVADLACLYLAAVSAPLQTGLGPAELKALIRQAGLRCIVCSEEQRASLEAVLPECPSVECLVLMGAAARGAAQARPKGYAMADLERRGRERGMVPVVHPSARPSAERDPLMALLYTSGSTGTPKAAMFPESLVHAQWRRRSFSGAERDALEIPHVTLNYMPLNHDAGRAMVAHSIRQGGTTFFVSKSDMSTLFEDAALSRPTTMLLVPRVASALYQRFQTELVRRAQVRGDRAPAGGAPGAVARERGEVEREVLAEMRESVLGDRLLQLMTGTAPTPPEVASFLGRCFDVPVFDTYGATEAGPVTFENRVDTSAVIAWKLVDVPELGFRTSDRPYPRGALRLKSRFAIPGYLGDERATRALFDDEGLLDTGDIVEQRGPQTLVWVGRAKDVLKLAQGEFVAPARLEGLFAARSPFIRQIYLHGDSFHSYLLAVIVPDADAVSARLVRLGAGERDAAFDPNGPQVKRLLRAELDRVAREEKLRGHEVPRDFVVEREPFSVENGLLTESKKQSRPRLAKRYQRRLDAAYAAIERAQVEELYALGGPLARAPVAERVRKAMSVTLGLEEIGASEAEQSFINLGGDSLSAVGLATLIRDLTAVEVPVGLLLDPTSSVQAVVEYVERALARADGGVQAGVAAAEEESEADVVTSFAQVHGEGATSIRAGDVRVSKFLPEDAFERARAADFERKLPARAQVALLTGADGFLGRHLVLELLERLGAASGRAKKKTPKLYALVRAPNDAAARERLAARYRTDPRLERRFQAVSANLTVLAGDLIAPRLRLSADTYARLASEVDLIVHNGALVNHALGYPQVFAPNVVGTARVIRLALERRLKSVSYVSTVGVVRGIDAANIGSEARRPILEDEDLRALVPERAIASGYAAGYVTSKWVSEVLLRDAHDALGLPVAVFRPGEMMAHTEYRGQVNVPDFFSRLVAGIVYTGLAPESFYAPGAPAHVRQFDGLPVDVVARAIAAPSVVREAGRPYRVYHVVSSPRPGGASLDDVVAWVRRAGYAVERVLDYGEWYRRFHDRLESLSEVERQHSPLAILEAWSRPEGTRTQAPVDTRRLIERLRAIEPRLAELPPIGEAGIHKMLDDLAQLRVIERPAGSTIARLAASEDEPQQPSAQYT